MTDQLGELYRISIQHVGKSNASREWRVIFDNVPVANVVPLLNKLMAGEYKPEGIDPKAIKATKVERIA